MTVLDDYLGVAPSFRVLAACRGMDPDLFFPERGASTREAKAICNSCPIRTDCLEYALTNGERFGIWGGMSERQRRAIRRDAGIRVRPKTISVIVNSAYPASPSALRQRKARAKKAAQVPLSKPVPGIENIVDILQSLSESFA